MASLNSAGVHEEIHSLRRSGAVAKYITAKVIRIKIAVNNLLVVFEFSLMSIRLSPKAGITRVRLAKRPPTQKRCHNDEIRLV